MMLSPFQNAINHPTSTLLQGVLEGLSDGILILTEQGEWVYGNYGAHQICQQLNQGKPNLQAVPDAIWATCQLLIESREFYPHQPVILESEIVVERTQVFRIRVRWLPPEDVKRPYLIVLLEDCQESLRNRALSEVQQYNLTARQAEVWLLHRAGYRYREIAAELFISVETVKKHIKDIHNKQQQLKP